MRNRCIRFIAACITVIVLIVDKEGVAAFPVVSKAKRAKRDPVPSLAIRPTDVTAPKTEHEISFSFLSVSAPDSLTRSVASLLDGLAFEGSPIVLGTSPKANNASQLFTLDSSNKIHAKSNYSLCLSASPSVSFDARVILAPCSKAVVWSISGSKFHPNGDKSLCLDNYKLLQEERNVIGIWSCNLGWNQNWNLSAFIPVPAFETVPPHIIPSTAATREPDTSVSSIIQATQTPDADVIPIPEILPLSTPLSVGGNRNLIAQARSGKATERTRIVLAPYSHEATSTQLFSFDAANKIHIAANESLCLNVASVVSNQMVFLAPCNESISWTVAGKQFHPEGNAKLCLDNYNLLETSGNAIGIWTCNGGWNQEWSMGLVMPVSGFPKKSVIPSLSAHTVDSQSSAASVENELTTTAKTLTNKEGVEEPRINSTTRDDLLTSNNESIKTSNAPIASDAVPTTTTSLFTTTMEEEPMTEMETGMPTVPWINLQKPHHSSLSHISSTASFVEPVTENTSLKPELSSLLDKQTLAISDIQVETSVIIVEGPFTTDTDVNPDSLHFTPLSVGESGRLVASITKAAVNAPIVLSHHDAKLQNNSHLFALDAEHKIRIKTNTSLCIGAKVVAHDRKIFLVKCSSTKAIKWTLDGRLFHPNGHRELCLDNYHLLEDDGNTVGIWTCNGGWNQDWYFGEPVHPSSGIVESAVTTDSGHDVYTVVTRIRRPKTTTTDTNDIVPSPSPPHSTTSSMKVYYVTEFIEEEEEATSTISASVSQTTPVDITSRLPSPSSLHSETSSMEDEKASTTSAPADILSHSPSVHSTTSSMKVYYVTEFFEEEDEETSTTSTSVSQTTPTSTTSHFPTTSPMQSTTSSMKVYYVTEFVEEEEEETSTTSADATPAITQTTPPGIKSDFQPSNYTKTATQEPSTMPSSRIEISTLDITERPISKFIEVPNEEPTTTLTTETQTTTNSAPITNNAEPETTTTTASEEEEETFTPFLLEKHNFMIAAQRGRTAQDIPIVLTEFKLSSPQPNLNASELFSMDEQGHIRILGGGGELCVTAASVADQQPVFLGACETAVVWKFGEDGLIHPMEDESLCLDDYHLTVKEGNEIGIWRCNENWTNAWKLGDPVGVVETQVPSSAVELASIRGIKTDTSAVPMPPPPMKYQFPLETETEEDMEIDIELSTTSSSGVFATSSSLRTTQDSSTAPPGPSVGQAEVSTIHSSLLSETVSTCTAPESVVYVYVYEPLPSSTETNTWISSAASTTTESSSTSTSTSTTQTSTTSSTTSETTTTTQTSTTTTSATTATTSTSTTSTSSSSTTTTSFSLLPNISTTTFNRQSPLKTTSTTEECKKETIFITILDEQESEAEPQPPTPSSVSAPKPFKINFTPLLVGPNRTWIASVHNNVIAPKSPLVLANYSHQLIKAQLFGLDENNRMRIQANQSLCLAAHPAFFDHRVVLADCESSDAIMWTVEGQKMHPNGDKNLCLDNYNLLEKVGNQIGLWTCNGGWNQDWTLGF
ncbi:hypothetical protein HDU77_007776 [Chytriomyces hyalinus]|nr:hypothetical protein HDU77_007776 [Chytriomyces hyalinus]